MFQVVYLMQLKVWQNSSLVNIMECSKRRTLKQYTEPANVRMLRTVGGENVKHQPEDSLTRRLCRIWLTFWMLHVFSAARTDRRVGRIPGGPVPAYPKYQTEESASRTDICPGRRAKSAL